MTRSGDSPCRRYRPVVALSALFLLAGCSVTPQPADIGAIDDRAQEDRQALDDAQGPIPSALTASEAVARALLYNRERKVRAMQTALRSRQLDAAEFQMLPSLTARAGYTQRSEFAATGSVPFVDGEPQESASTDSFSVSQEKSRNTYGVDFTWSILDFGLSYVRAQQKADQYLIAQEEERKAIQNLAQDVRAAYWKAVSADRLLDKVGPLLEQVNSALDDSRRISAERLSDPMQSFSYQRGILDIKRSLASLREELVGAEAQLARLMGLSPDTEIPLPDYDNDDLQAPELPIDLATMERTALVLRPEILTSHYRERISRKEVRVALLQMFPDLSLNAGYAYDDNRYLRYNEWTSAGAEVSWDLFQIFKAASDKKAAETSVDVAREQRLASSIAVLTQVHLSVLQFEEARRKLGTAREYLDVSRSISDLVADQSDTDGAGRLQVIKEELNALVAELRRDLAYAEVQNNFARIFKSIGLDPYPQRAQSPERLAVGINARRRVWEGGQIAVVIRSIADQQPVLTFDDTDKPAFQFRADTFSVVGDVTYTASRANGDPLPDWLEFDGSTRTFTGAAPADVDSIAVRVRAENESGVYARDRFELKAAGQRL